MASVGRIIADPYMNKRGSQIDKGMVVIDNVGTANSVTTTTTSADQRARGIAMENITNDTDGRIQTGGKVAYALVQGVCTIGHFLKPSTTAGRLDDTGVAYGAAVSAPTGSCAIALETGTTTNIRVQWIGSQAGGAPVDAIYIVGASNGTLSAEIVVTAPSSGGVIPKTILKTANETVNNSAVLQNDDHLIFPLGANETWALELYVMYTSSGGADLKYAFTFPAGATGVSHGTVLNSVVTLEPHMGPLSAFTGSTVGGNVTALPLLHKMIVVNGGTAGNFQFQWAQNAAEVSNTVVLLGSYIIGHKLN